MDHSWQDASRDVQGPRQPMEQTDNDDDHHDGGASVGLSPSSAAAVASMSQSRASFHRWPSYALDASDASVSSFVLFQGSNNNQAPRAQPRFFTTSINLLKMPWHHPHHENNRNPYKVLRAFFAALFLTTTLSLASAWDAQIHCVSNETDALVSLLGTRSDEGEDQQHQPSGDQEAAAMQEEYNAEDLSEEDVLAVIATCTKMFRNVMLPVGLVTGLGSLLALAILKQHQKSFGGGRAAQSAPPLIAHSPPSFYFFYLPLLFMSGLTLAAWTVGIVLVMLRPSSNDTDNPYSSLAAVDSMGRVADNANLYYLSWISEGLAILIFYQLFGAWVRQSWHPTLSASAALAVTSAPSTLSTASSTLLFPWNRIMPPMLTQSAPSATASKDGPLVTLAGHRGPRMAPSALPGFSNSHHMHTRYHSSRLRWFQTFYRLRLRTGMWVAALLSALVVVTSSAHMFHEVLLPAAKSLYVDDDYLANEDHHTWWNVIEDNKSYNKVCLILASDPSVSQLLCRRTFFSLLTGFVAVILCFTAIVLHLLTRRSAAADALYVEACGAVYPEMAIEMMSIKHHHLPLQSELVLSIVLSLWLGWNAFLVSSVQGPAPRVGNLYYASWFSFLLCLRICLGCVEELHDITEDNDHQNQQGEHDRSHPEAQSSSKKNHHSKSSYRAPDLARVEDNEDENADDDNRCSDNTNFNVPVPEHTVQEEHELRKQAERQVKLMMAKAEKERGKRMRRYFFLGTFSTVSAASAFDAASNQAYSLSRLQMFTILAPTVVAASSALLFALCLSKSTYAVVSQFWCGGALCMAAFGVWLVDLVITMHSHDSWAVNRVGEIENANLYYFSWAAIITAGLQMSSYMKDALHDILGDKSKDYMSVVWAAIYKVCFVVLGASLHIWNTISDSCGLEFRASGITYCSRTVLAMVVAITGLVIGGSVLFVRVIIPTSWFSTRSRAHCEAVMSIFLVLLFGVATAMITGIGGPGQSVGDLYYATWLAFWVSIGISVSCYDQITFEELEATQSQEYEDAEMI